MLMWISEHRWVVAILVTVSVLVACVVPVPPQGWRPDRGPVVPHDTFPADCALCHETGDWHTIKAGFVFDHDSETGWPLIGAHTVAECLLCHNDRGPAGVFSQRGCRGCHEDPHQGHLGPLCEACHGNDDWRPREAIATHGSTRFPLTGAHALTACFACHPGSTAGNFQIADIRCAACHRQDALDVATPDHRALGWNECEDCHKTTSFADARFDHPSSFPLSAGHASVSCQKCHGPGKLGALSTACESCHMDDFRATTDPNHAAAGFPTDCRSCHRPTNWRRARFDHTTFALTGAHKRTDCSSCHAGGRFAGTPQDCIACHDADFRGTKNPDHVAGGFSTDCTECHNTSTFVGADFDHQTVFPLTGAHKRIDCSDCHEGGVFAGTPRDCIGCHDADYRRVRDPDHVAARFSLDCAQCHGTSTFSGATIDHSTFALTGRHRTADCSDCHTGGVFLGTPRDCAGCHLGDYNGARNPDHRASGFPTMCESCHTSTTTWKGARFNHTFPIDSGPHKRLDCSDCHTSSSSVTQFSCTHCHEHRKSEADKEHREVRGYVWSSPACLQCHPRGRED